MSTSQIQVEPIEWTDLPDDHRLGFGWNKREEDLEDVSQALKAADIEGSKKEGLDWEEQLDSIIGLSSENYDDKEAINAVQSELEEEREAIDRTKELFNEAAELAEEHVKEIRKELGIAEAREKDWYSANEAIKIDSFHYTHAQSWYPVLEKTDKVEIKDDLQTISERALEEDHAADAYRIDRDTYQEITSDLKNPLQKLIAVGKLGEEDEYRQKVEEQLKDSLRDWITSEEAEEYIEKLDKNLDWRTTERYLDPDQLREDTVKSLKQSLNIDEDADEEKVLRYKLAQELASGRIKEDKVREQFSESLVENLRDMQENLQSKSRGRLINSLENPEETEIEDVLSSHYKRDKRLWLATYWKNNGQPTKKSKSRVHADISRIGNNIFANYYTAQNIIPKDLLESIDNIGANVPKPRYWQKGKNPIFKPDLPLNSHQQGMICSTITQGKTYISEADKRDNPHLAYQFSNKDNSKIRREAIQNLFSGEKGIGKYDLNWTKPSPNTDSEMFRGYTEGDLNDTFRANLPTYLGFFSKVTEQNPEYLKDKTFAKGYVEQAMWDRGFATKDDVQLEPKNHENFTQALEILEINYHESDIPHGNEKRIGLNNTEISKYEFLEEFQQAYQEAIS